MESFAVVFPFITLQKLDFLPATKNFFLFPRTTIALPSTVNSRRSMGITLMSYHCKEKSGKMKNLENI